jgi:hypothetical protein
VSEDTYTCYRHDRVIAYGEPGPECLEWFKTVPKRDQMTADERVAEMNLRCGTVTVPFEIVHARIEELAGRPVWTHEMANREHLLDLARKER